MKPFLLALATALTLAACQSAPAGSKAKVPASTPPEENAAPPADTARKM